LVSPGGKEEGVRRIPLLFLIYLVIGVVVAYSQDYFDNVEKTKQLISAILAVVLWPLVLFGYDVKVT
jgi:cell division protein FtsW (lipid II flippase)